MENFEEMKNIDLRTVDRSTLVDIRDIVIDEKLSKEERMKSYLKQIKNPFCFRHGDMVVKVRYNEKGETLESLIANLLIHI